MSVPDASFTPRPRVVVCDKDWPVQAAEHVMTDLRSAPQLPRRQCIVLTGGESASRMYDAWRQLSDFGEISDSDFYFGDERCVAPDSGYSNYGTAMRTLFRDGLPGDSTVQKMFHGNEDPREAALVYESVLPDVLDVVLLGLGEDGHIASLFPRSGGLKEWNRKVIAVTAPVAPHERMTVTPKVISSARRIFLLAPGKTKHDVLSAALRDPERVEEMPVRMLLGGTWLLDRPLDVPRMQGASASCH